MGGDGAMITSRDVERYQELQAECDRLRRTEPPSPDELCDAECEGVPGKPWRERSHSVGCRARQDAYSAHWSPWFRRGGWGDEAAELRERAKAETWSDLSTRAANCLAWGGFFLREQVANTPDKALLNLRNFGKTTLAEIRAHVPYTPPRVVQPSWSRLEYIPA